MAHRNVEIVIGRLSTDEGFRDRFAADAEAVLGEVIEHGLELTPIERRALAHLDVAACARFARHIDPRLQKLCLRRTLSREPCKPS